MAKRAKQNKQGQTGQIRIIGGEFRGRKLPVLDAEGLRPTSDRVKETLFNWLQFDVAGARCLDLYAGSGSLSFEALSRGAKNAVLLELSAANAKQLKQNLAALDIHNASVHQVDSLQWLSEPIAEPFDIVFIDPPFHKDLMAASLERLFANGFITESSILYLEQENSLAWPQLPTGWYCHREKKTSQVQFGVFRFAED